MASPSLDTFCCAVSEDHPSLQRRLHFSSSPYNIVCAISSLLGIFGASYQIFPSSDDSHSRHAPLSGHRQKHIITYLAVADLFASFGIFLRSILWLTENDWMSNIDSEAGSSFCAIISGWIQFCYGATYLWTLCYAIDVLKTIKQKTWTPIIYHCVAWGIPMTLTICGMTVLYAPDFKCHSNVFHVLTNYLITYIPILTVMIVNPVLYCVASNKAIQLVSSLLGRFTQQERQMMSALREKFFSIVLVFYVCWSPNVLNGLLLWTTWGQLPRKFLIGLWYVMAVINPLQAVMNAFVYRGCRDLRKWCWILWSLRPWSVTCGEPPHPSYTEIEDTDIAADSSFFINLFRSDAMVST
ncbi:G-protein coupled receptor 143-like isoform X1 [Limulus polyphemus]|uniref:G-protein coupled receptor 143-like isoform X1 n=1 Tax=Limulus polyphemus TaxID=6850 RepID=A0ABM1SGL7_LIMPO|nr:G-protein coupled receptor 143-like isoform X1 [Limulus polyphemus]XP_022242772.1 G-protein coupled receptor 143-like isoform X1 [Limulus polyphemus]